MASLLGEANRPRLEDSNLGAQDADQLGAVPLARGEIQDYMSVGQFLPGLGGTQGRR